MVFDTIFVCHFVDRNTGVEIAFEKEGTRKLQGLILKEGDETPGAHCELLISCKVCLLF